LLQRFIKKKYTDFRFERALLTYLPDAYAAGAIVGKFRRIPRWIRYYPEIIGNSFCRAVAFRPPL
jgi:hypothetical protein